MRRLEFRVHGIQDLLEFAGQGTRDSYMVKEFQRSAEGALQILCPGLNQWVMRKLPKVRERMMRENGGNSAQSSLRAGRNVCFLQSSGKTRLVEY